MIVCFMGVVFGFGFDFQKEVGLVRTRGASESGVLSFPGCGPPAPGRPPPFFLGRNHLSENRAAEWWQVPESLCQKFPGYE